jgi:hypothetical protein
MKPIYITESGKLGTAAQSHAWTSLGYASNLWGKLSEDQYQAWDEAAKKENRRRHLRKGRRLNGHNLFTECPALSATRLRLSWVCSGCW